MIRCVPKIMPLLVTHQPRKGIAFPIAGIWNDHPVRADAGAGDRSGLGFHDCAERFGVPCEVDLSVSIAAILLGRQVRIEPARRLEPKPQANKRCPRQYNANRYNDRAGAKAVAVLVH